MLNWRANSAARSSLKLALEDTLRKWLYRQTSQEVCPWNVKFSQELLEESPFAVRAIFVDKDAQTLARDLGDGSGAVRSRVQRLGMSSQTTRPVSDAASLTRAG